MAKRASLSILDFTWMKPNVETWFQYTPQGSNEVFVKAKLVDYDFNTNKAILNYNNEEIVTDYSMIFPLNPQDSEGFEDMVNMEFLNEAELLHNVKMRFEKNKIFTYVGPTLLAINPYMQIKELFNEQLLNYYQEQANLPHFVTKDHNPHIYAVAGAVVNALIENKKNQAIVISGESGAGKTEETKLAMKFITTMGK
jgi:myosin heavy subunit